MKTPTTLIAALLIGGRSRRMGSAKALLRRGPTTLGAYLFDLLARRLNRPPLVVGQGELDLAGTHFQRIPDREPGAGPLSAVLGLFDHNPEAVYLVLPVDLYAMDASELDWLIGEHDAGSKVAVRPLMPGRPHGEPLPAIYCAAARAALETSWKRGERGLAASLPGEMVHEPQIPKEHIRALTGVNRPEELAALRQAMAPDKV